MNRAEKLFVVIDKLFNPLQNKIKFPDITVEKDLVYCDKFKDDCLTDLYYDKKVKGKYPVFINIHGGGFVRGDKAFRRSLCGKFASKGYFVVNANYRLSPKYAFPAVAEDMVELLNFIPTIAEKYNLDLTKVIISGDSAGAYYATMATAICFNEEFRNALNLSEPMLKVTSLIGFCGPYNLLIALKKKMPFGLTKTIGESFTGIKLDKKLSNITDFKHLDYLNPTKFLVEEKWVPTFIVYAKKDIFCKGHAEEWIKELDEKNIPYESYYSTELFKNHCFHLFLNDKKSKECFNKIDAFLEKLN